MKYHHISFRRKKNRPTQSHLSKMQKMILAEAASVLLLAALVILQASMLRRDSSSRILENDTITVEVAADATGVEKDYIKWVDFKVSYEALCQAYEWDVETHDSEHWIDWIDLLAYTAARTGGAFDKKALSILDKAAQEICDGKTTMEKLTEDLKYYPYYKEAYAAVLGGMVGEYEEEYEDNGEKGYRSRYGLKAYFPLARGFDYTHYDDFGAGRSYGYQRRHLGSYVIIVSSW